VNEAIQFDQVSKRFILHHERPRSLQELAVSLLRRDSSRREEFWALRDVSFTVPVGETVGLIGPNGAGKSTILKLISRIIQPTSGHITVEGRLGALLELGAGFHPDLTGRENIFLNGSIMGLRRREIKQRLESIVDFAELSRFIDMPVRNYSSGMLVRLGFAVATSFQPDVLLIDEVLAVGDEMFQVKCLQRIAQVRDQGISILFVSHNLDTVRHLCNHVIWMDKGQVQASGDGNTVIGDYLKHVWSTDNSPISAAQAKGKGRRWGSGEVEITDVQFYAADGKERHTFETGERMTIRADYVAHTKVHRPVFGMAIHREDEVQVSESNTRFSGCDIDCIEGHGQIEYTVELPLLAGDYLVSMAVYDDTIRHPYDHREQQFALRVYNGPTPERYGIVRIPCQWKHVVAARD
jgi:ABC-type polysaccharide/polyol phosphate transport system ATPase subunit